MAEACKSFQCLCRIFLVKTSCMGFGECLDDLQLTEYDPTFASLFAFPLNMLCCTFRRLLGKAGLLSSAEHPRYHLYIYVKAQSSSKGFWF